MKKIILSAALALATAAPAHAFTRLHPSPDGSTSITYHGDSIACNPAADYDYSWYNLAETLGDGTPFQNGPAFLNDAASGIEFSAITFIGDTADQDDWTVLTMWGLADIDGVQSVCLLGATERERESF